MDDMATGTVQMYERAWKRLWTNPSPSSDYAAGDVAIANIGNYTEYRVQFKDYKTATAPSLSAVIFGVGKANQWAFNAAKFHYRDAQITANGVTFSDCTTVDTYGAPSSGTKTNGYLIPVYIEAR